MDNKTLTFVMPPTMKTMTTYKKTHDVLCIECITPEAHTTQC